MQNHLNARAGGVYEISKCYDTDTYRAVYAVPSKMEKISIDTICRVFLLIYTIGRYRSNPNT
jgi:hypothetical protein